MTTWQPYIISFIIGLLVGIEREKAHPRQKTMGVRTFILISLLGALAGSFQNYWASAMIASFSFTLIAISYFSQVMTKSTKADIGLTTEFAAGIIFALGYISHHSPALAALLGPLVAVILFSKKAIHKFSHAIKPSEYEAALLILLAGVVVTDFVPNKTIDPWGVFNPRQFGYLTLILASIEFLGYLLSKVLGEKRGSLILGFLAGFVSSTAVLISSAKNAKDNPIKWRSFICSTLAAQLASLIELLLIVGVTSQVLFLKVLLPIGLVILMVTLALVIVAKTTINYKQELEVRSPLEWKGVLRLSFMLIFILALVTMTKKLVGDQATNILTFITGLFELHASVFASSSMYSNDQLDINAARTNILLATIASFISKIAISWFLSRDIFSCVLTLILSPMIVVVTFIVWYVS